MSVFKSDLLNEYKKKFFIWHKVSKDDDYGGYESVWTRGAKFEGILTEDNSITATIAGVDTKKNFYGIKVGRDVPLVFHSIIQRVDDGKFFRIISGDVLNSPKMSALDMKILSAEEYEPTDWEEQEVIDDGDS